MFAAFFTVDYGNKMYPPDVLALIFSALISIDYLCFYMKFSTWDMVDKDPAYALQVLDRLPVMDLLLEDRWDAVFCRVKRMFVRVAVHLGHPQASFYKALKTCFQTQDRLVFGENLTTLRLMSAEDLHAKLAYSLLAHFTGPSDMSFATLLEIATSVPDHEILTAIEKVLKVECISSNEIVGRVPLPVWKVDRTDPLQPCHLLQQYPDAHINPAEYPLPHREGLLNRLQCSYCKVGFIVNAFAYRIYYCYM